MFFCLAQSTLFVNKSLIIVVENFQKYPWIQYKKAQIVVVTRQRNNFFTASKVSVSILIWFPLSLQLRVAFFYAESNGVFGNFLRQLLKICIQVKWIYQMKRNLLALLVHSHLFSYLVTKAGCVFLCWIKWYFWKFSTTIIKDL